MAATNQQPIVLAIGGLAKNTGKTTALKKIISELKEKGKLFLLTGIGYDGESFDLITGLPKPRFYLETGNYLLTTAGLDAYQWANRNMQKQNQGIYTVIQEFDIKNPLGDLVLGEIKESGYFLLAGPNKGHDLERAINSITLNPSPLTLIDGAINRLVPLSVSTKLILALGASYSTNFDYLSQTAQALQYLFSPKLPPNPQINISQHLYFRDDEGVKTYPFTSLFTINTLDKIVREIKGKIKELFVPGIVSSSIFEKINPYFDHDAVFWLKNPFVLMATNNAIYWKESFCKVNVRVCFYQSPQLIAFTLNPFYPYYESGKFHPRYLPAELLMEKISSSVDIPVFDVVKNPEKNISELFL
ncbi:MAG: hypothetical protein DDT42_00822 [candidate division WS2 bacterium]|uniref:Uncharacterized protein n=1 Tax=Psychracetigena formicireducens TaxID=2986056 RepID=A0A9E2BG39_PSYF1|nr:hypothetical protein [Candidatus Psychracetigena formicireducens]MBT9144963.1 hypothetical protein [Candidatus Psychracetigena formicireducens]MBT9147652.1 hypothetical protein [Bacillota bacterium]